jgi:hypothetical protein
MRSTILGLAVSSVLSMPADVIVSGAGQAIEGTAISSELHKAAKAAIKAAWQTHEKIVSLSKMLLELAQACVREANGDFKLALSKFDAACGSAAHEMRESNKDATGEAKAKLDEFLADDGSWKNYQKGLRQAMKDEFPILEYQTESSLRAARKAAAEAARTRKSMRDKIGEKLDLDGLTDEEYATACKAATGSTGTLTEERLENELRKLGYVEPEDEDEDVREKRITSEAKQTAEHWFGADARWQVPRESLAKLLILISNIDDDAGHETEVNRALNNAYVTIARVIKGETAEAPKTGGGKSGERRVVDA